MEENVKKRRHSISNRQLLIAAGGGDTDGVTRCLKDGASVDFQDTEGNTALHWAASQGRLQVVKHMLDDTGANVIVENNQLKTALDLAWEHKHADVMETVGKAIVDKCRNTLVKQGHQAQPSTEKPLQFVDATLAGDYTCLLDEKEIRDVFFFFCLPLPEDTETENLNFSLKVTLAVPVKVDVSSNATVTLTLLHNDVDGEPQETYYLINGTSKDNWGNMCDYTIPLDATDDHEKQIEGLVKILRVCEGLPSANMSKKENKIKENIKKIENLCGQITDETLVDGRKLFANVFNEIKRTNSKIKACLRLLKKLSNPNFEGFTNDSAQCANCVIFFLETFSLQDTDFLIPMDKNPLSGVNNNDNQLKVKNNLAIIKKRAYSKYYPECKATMKVSQSSKKEQTVTQETPKSSANEQKASKKQNPFLVAIANVRRRVVKAKNYCQDPNIFETFLADGVNVASLFESLILFGETVKTNVENSTPFTGEQNMFIRAEGEVEEEKKIPLDDVLKRFTEILRNENKESEVIERLCFDMLANISPNLNVDDKDKKPRIVGLRNRIIHGFENQTLQKCEKEMSVALHDSYRFQLADAVSEKFSKLEVDEEEASLKATVSKAISEVNCKYTLNLEFLKREQGERYSFVYYDGDESWIKKKAEHFVGKYLRFMVPILHSAEEESELEESDGDPDHLTNLSTIDKRELFELCMNTEFADSVDDTYRQYRLDVQNMLKKKLFFSETKATKVVQEVTSCGKINTELEEIITDVLKGWHSLSEIEFKKGVKSVLTPKDVAELCAAFSNEVGPFKFSNHDSSLLKYRHLTERTKKRIEEEISRLPYESIVNTRLPSGQVLSKLQIHNIILNLLQIFGDVHRVYRLKIEDAETAFQDENFVDYLSSREIENIGKKLKFRDSLHTYKNIRAVRALKCAAPYVAMLLTKTRDFRVIEMESLRNIVHCLMSENAWNTYLNNLVASALASEEENVPVIKVFAEALTSNDLSIAKTRELLRAPCRSGKIKKILDCVSKLREKGLENRFKSILLALNDLLLECINEKLLETAKNMVKDLTEFQEKIKHDSHEKSTEFIPEKVLRSISNVRRLHAAKLHNAEGTKLCAGYWKQDKSRRVVSVCPGEPLFTMALEELQSVLEPDKHLNFLCLSRTAHTHYLINRCQRNKSEEALLVPFEFQTKLYREMWQYISVKPYSDTLTVHEYYRRATASSLYTTLLSSCADSKYLGVLKVYSTIAFYKWEGKKHSSAGLRDMLKMWSNIYHINKTCPSDDRYSKNFGYVLHKMTKICEELYKVKEGNYYAYKTLELAFLCFQSYVDCHGTSSWLALKTRQLLSSKVDAHTSYNV